MYLNFIDFTFSTNTSSCLKTTSSRTFQMECDSIIKFDPPLVATLAPAIADNVVRQTAKISSNLFILYSFGCY